MRIHRARGGVFLRPRVVSDGESDVPVGVTLTIGPKQTVKFFVRPRNQRGAFCFLFGLALVLYGWPFIGLLVEGYGFVALFSAFFPTVLIFLKRVPVLGSFLSLPGVKHVTTSIIGKSQTLPV